jgi:hypothetical protein
VTLVVAIAAHVGPSPIVTPTSLRPLGRVAA